MIRTMLRLGWLNLKRDYVALGLSFVLPVVFFSIFAAVFGSMGQNEGMSKPRVALVDLDQSAASRRFVEVLGDEEGGLRVQLAPEDRPDRPYDREEALALTRSGKVAAALILPAGLGAAFGRFDGTAPAVELVHDEADPVASHVVAGLLQRAAIVAAPDLLMKNGIEMLERYGEPLTPRQRSAVDSFNAELVGPDSEDGSTPEGGAGGAMSGIVAVKATGVRAEDERQASSATAFYAAGTGVMFLLFSMAGAGGTLLDEQDSGTLDRLLMSNLGMGKLLLSKWIFIAAMGALQVLLMFLWGSLVFGLDLFTPNHFAGFTVMTLVTASAAAGFGMLLATACRSRAQLSGVSTIVILVMSAVGGSMFPRFLMPPGLQKAGLLTFNGWALDGYLKVFWYENPADGVVESLLRLWPQVLVLALLTVAFLALSRLLARRWETA